MDAKKSSMARSQFFEATSTDTASPCCLTKKNFFNDAGLAETNPSHQPIKPLKTTH
jgi:hypothetical protein